MGYVWSTSDERFFSDEHDTREEALAEGLDAEPGATIYTGLVRRVTVHELATSTYYLDGHSVVEGMGEAAYDIVGEACEMWEDSVPSDSLNDLTGRLVSAVMDWAEEHGIEPKFFEVQRIEEHPTNTPHDSAVKNPATTEVVK